MPVRRREIIAGALGLAVLGGGAVYASRPSDSGAVQPVEVETLDAPGSEAGVVEVPSTGEVSVVEFFATWCRVCAGMMENLNEVNDRIGDEVQFVSVTNEPVGHTVTREDVTDWWRDHDGAWTVGIDDDLVLTDRLDV
ncbi:MAG: thioredoxin domain-containing protein [Halobacteriales archaeon]|nr:thioredoxin domain-containing protein [Halobacteriales archaeon]